MKFLCVLLLSVPVLLHGQGMVDGFTRGKGNTDLALTLSAELSKKYYAGTDKVSLGRNKTIGSIFAARGITDWMDISANIPYIKLNDETDFQDGALYIKVKPWSRKISENTWSFLASAGLRAPLSNYQTEGGSAIGQQDTTIDVRGLAQLHLSSGVFIAIQSGYTFKSSPVPSTFPAAIKVGKTADGYYVDGWVDFQYTDKGKDYRGEGDKKSNSFRELGVSYLKIGGVYYKTINETFGWTLGGDYVLLGRNTDKSLRVSVGLVLKL